jgi:phosphatidylglycerol:prolipoprotein diacylglycerol transferase
MTTTYLSFPQFDPVILHLVGPLAIRWYSLAYIMGVIFGWLYTRMILKKYPQEGLTVNNLDEVVSYLIMGIILGGRLGYVLCYKPLYFIHHPLDILKVWEGGMSFHGGLVGSALAFGLYAWRSHVPFFTLTDVASTAAPIGIFFGRLANFINGEVFGRITDVPWAVLFPTGGYLPRHPSQLYEAFLEGPVLFGLLLWVVFKRGKLYARGFVSGLFIFGYGIARFGVEFFREADEFLGYFLQHFTLGQFLSLPLMLYGAYLMWASRTQKWA